MQKLKKQKEKKQLQQHVKYKYYNKHTKTQEIIILNTKVVFLFYVLNSRTI